MCNKRPGYLSIDDGSGRTAVTFSIKGNMYWNIGLGDKVQVAVNPRLGLLKTSRSLRPHPAVRIRHDHARATLPAVQIARAPRGPPTVTGPGSTLSRLRPRLHGCASSANALLVQAGLRCRSLASRGK
jgi:hypothetical protein